MQLKRYILLFKLEVGRLSLMKFSSLQLNNLNLSERVVLLYNILIIIITKLNLLFVLLLVAESALKILLSETFSNFPLN
jgi:hypothetical protein